eukprot:TRINITY_DN18547_c0_g1_i11.p1 TRINITY_DN18547_c0_g1~~TRINITY_DN18547_c0_g1_i11.p1  ORF type:complete len:559 (-),score=139.83 TRINITY_DN18547_c0_g1_i11:270-1946(-)
MSPLLACAVLFGVSLLCPGCISNPHAKRLYDDLLHDYNRLIRPVQNFTETLTVNLGLKLSQLIDVNLKDQVMTTNVWVDQNWNDYKLKWNPNEYGGVKTLYVPSERIWLPDIVLYNNADGKYEVRLMTKAELKYNGDVKWTPPAIYKSSCEINVEWFPFDEQNCDMKFGSWTYDARQVDLKHMHQEPGNNVVEIGIDLTEFYLSVEWDILDVPATKNVENYNPEMDENEHHEDDDDESEDKLLTDITFILTMRRKTLFYTVNLIIPCVGISFLTVLVFYLPADSGEKVTLCISVLLSLTVFFLLLAEIIPPTSLAVPLLSKYLLFSMLLITLSIFITVGVLNIHFRSPSTHKMSPWMKNTFLTVLPKLLLMRRPHYSPRYLKQYEDTSKSEPPAYIDNNTKGTQVGYQLPAYGELESPKFVTSPKLTESRKYSQETMASNSDDKTGQDHYIKANGTVAHFGGLSDDALSLSDTVSQLFSPEVENALLGVQFIAQHIRDNDKDNEVMEDWKYIAMVLDRLFLWLFTLTCLGGTAFIILRAPSLYDMREPIDARHTTIGN